MAIADTGVEVEASTGPAAAGGREPAWLRRWRTKPLDPGAAMTRFEGLPPIDPAEMLGAWRGAGLPTGHPFDGMLQALGWHGKRFEDVDRAHPLLFGTSPNLFAVNPALLPAGLALRWPSLARSRAVRALLPLFSTRKPVATLRNIEVRGTVSAAMLYDRQPIVDHFRRIGPGHVLGMMEMRGLAPYFFVLVRDD